MKAEKVEQLLNDYPQFVISYYAKKHGKIINRQGTWTKPNTDKTLKRTRVALLSNCFITSSS